MKTKCESRPWALTERAESAVSSKWAAFSELLARTSLKLCKPPPGSRPEDLCHFWVLDILVEVRQGFVLKVILSWEVFFKSRLKLSFCQTHHINNFSAKFEEDFKVEIRLHDEYLKRAGAELSIFRHFPQRVLQYTHQLFHALLKHIMLSTWNRALATLAYRISVKITTPATRPGHYSANWTLLA